MSNNNNASSGASITTVLFVVFVVLKLTGNVDWSWLWVTSPLWISAGLALALLGFLVLIQVRYSRKQRRRLARESALYDGGGRGVEILRRIASAGGNIPAETEDADVVESLRRCGLVKTRRGGVELTTEGAQELNSPRATRYFERRTEGIEDPQEIFNSFFGKFFGSPPRHS